MEEELDRLINEMPLLKNNLEFIEEVTAYITEKIEIENVVILRGQISKAYAYVSYLTTLKSKAEALYRVAQSKASDGLSKSIVTQAREAQLNGASAPYRYMRDIYTGYLSDLTSKITASMGILRSLDIDGQRNRGA